MKNYKNDILNKLIDSYENSAYYNGKSDRKRKISFDVRKNFKRYGQSDNFIETDKIDNVIEELYFKNYVFPGKSNDFRNYEIILNTNEEIIDEIYQSIGRQKKSEQREIFIERLKSITKKCDWVEAFTREMIARVFEGKSIKPYFDSMNIEELDYIITILNYMAEQSTEISFRRFSILVFKDSKKLERYKTKVFNIIHDFYDDSIETIDAAFACFNIYRNPSFIYVKGNMTIQINNQVIDLSEMNYSFSIPSESLASLQILNIVADKVITVENLMSFYDAYVSNALIIYLGGYHNTARRKFLLKIYEYLKDNVIYYHFGDIDVGGFNIYLDLIAKTAIPFKPLMMDLDTLLKYKDYCKELSLEEVSRLLKVKEKFSNPVIYYMIENKVKLEQEIVDLDIVL